MRLHGDEMMVRVMAGVKPEEPLVGVALGVLGAGGPPSNRPPAD